MDWPGASGRVLIGSRRIPAVSSAYTDCGAPEFMLRSPAYDTRLTLGSSGAGKADARLPFTSTAVGRNTPAKPSYRGRASGTLTTPWEVKPRVSVAMNGTGWSKTTRPVASVTLNSGA